MSILGGLDAHRAQSTDDWVDIDTGQRRQGQLARPAGHLRAGGCTGWPQVVEELQPAGITAQLAEPADPGALGGRNHHATTDRADAGHLRGLLMGSAARVGDPAGARAGARTQLRPSKAWSTSAPPSSSAATRCCSPTACRASLPRWSPNAARACPRQRAHPVAQQAVLMALGMVDAGNADLDRLTTWPVASPAAERWWGVRRRPDHRGGDRGGARRRAPLALLPGGGAPPRREVTVEAAEDEPAPGHLARQGPAALGVARKLARRRYHLLGTLGDDALAPVASGRTNRPRWWPDGAGGARPAHPANGVTPSSSTSPGQSARAPR